MSTQAHDIEEDLSRFQVSDAATIHSILEGMLDRRVFIAMTIPREGGSQFMSMLAGVDGRAILFDAPSDPALTGAVLRRGQLNASAQDGGVQVQFRLEGVRTTEQGGRQYLYCPLPADMYRIQRRNTYRVPVPLRDPVVCEVVFPHAVGGAAVTREFRVFDLSIGGLTLLLPDDAPDLPIDTRLEHCALRLPDTDPIEITLVVRNSFPLLTRNDNIRKRIGCEFADLRGSAENRVQRYVFKVERSLRAKT